jgi:hypothetical protein
MFSRWRKFIIAPILAGVVLVPATVYGSGKLGAVLSARGAESGIPAKSAVTPAGRSRSSESKPRSRAAVSRSHRHRSAKQAAPAKQATPARQATPAKQAAPASPEALRTAATEPRPCNYLGCRGFHMLGIGF